MFRSHRGVGVMPFVAVRDLRMYSRSAAQVHACSALVAQAVTYAVHPISSRCPFPSISRSSPMINVVWVKLRVQISPLPWPTVPMMPMRYSTQ